MFRTRPCKVGQPPQRFKTLGWGPTRANSTDLPDKKAFLALQVFLISIVILNKNSENIKENFKFDQRSFAVDLKH